MKLLPLTTLVSSLTLTDALPNALLPGPDSVAARAPEYTPLNVPDFVPGPAAVTRSLANRDRKDDLLVGTADQLETLAVFDMFVSGRKHCWAILCSKLDWKGTCRAWRHERLYTRCCMCAWTPCPSACALLANERHRWGELQQTILATTGMIVFGQ